MTSGSADEFTEKTEGAPIEICKARAPIMRARSKRVYRVKSPEAAHQASEYKGSCGPFGPAGKCTPNYIPAGRGPKCFLIITK